MILKRVIYGVDKNPMAVELAKLSLWLHSFTVGAPLSFLDHHLRCGDSLFGEWVRPAMERLSAGGLFANNAVAAAQGAIAGMARVEELTDSDVAEVHESAAQYRAIQEATAPLCSMLDALHGYQWQGSDVDNARKGQKAAKKRATKGASLEEREAGAADLAVLERRANALNVWLEGGFGDAVAAASTFYGKAHDPDAALALLGKAAAVAAEERFFHWEVGFPGVWQNWTSAQPEGGFDAVIGNPPWDRLKLQEVEWFAARVPAIAKAQKAADRKKLIVALEKAGDPLAEVYAKVAERADQAMAMAGRKPKDGGQYPLLGGGDVNLYSLFVERAHRLVKADGMVGVLVPSGIAADLGAAPFFRSLSTTGRLATLLDYENGGKFFPDVHAQTNFSAFVFGGTERRFETAECGFYLTETNELGLAAQTFAMTAADFERVNPNTGTSPIFRNRRDAELTGTIYARVPVLVDRRYTPPRASWPVRYATMFHMTNDSDKFHTRAELESDGFYPVGLGRMKRGKDEFLPLYEGKMIHQFNHRYATAVMRENSALGDSIIHEIGELSSPAFFNEGRFLVELNNSKLNSCKLSFRDTVNTENIRTVISAIIPHGFAGNTLPIIEGVSSIEAGLLSSCMNSFVVDFVARQKIQARHLNLYILEQLPILPPTAYAQPVGDMTAGDLVKREVLRLTYTAHDLAAFAHDLGHEGPPFAWDENDRRHRRARLDALYFILYGIGLEDADYILSTFPIVEREDRAAHGRYLTRDLILAYMNALAAGDTESVVAI
jgi:hypothetical protein